MNSWFKPIPISLGQCIGGGLGMRLGRVIDMFLHVVGGKGIYSLSTRPSQLSGTNRETRNYNLLNFDTVCLSMNHLKFGTCT